MLGGTIASRAAETEAATAGLARQVLDYLRRARYDGELRFMARDSVKLEKKTGQGTGALLSGPVSR